MYVHVSNMMRKKDKKLRNRVSGSRSTIKRTASTTSEQSMVSIVSFNSSPALGYLCQKVSLPVDLDLLVFI